MAIEQPPQPNPKPEYPRPVDPIDTPPPPDVKPVPPPDIPPPSDPPVLPERGDMAGR